MGLLDKIFKGKDGRPLGGPASTPADDDDDDASTVIAPRNVPRRELVQVVLRDTMRRHGIPSDWIEPRILSVASSSRGTGMHVVLMVRQGDDRLVTYVHAFQSSFMQELQKFEPKAAEWVFSLSWQFDGNPGAAHAAMPEPGSWEGKAAPVAAAAAAAGVDSGPAASTEEDDLEADLQALFAIRDAALKDGTPEGEQPDFEDTRPA